MPVIRDKSWAFESTTTDAGVVIPICDYVQNDLLLAIVMADAGTPTWTALQDLRSFLQETIPLQIFVISKLHLHRNQT